MQLDDCGSSSSSSIHASIIIPIEKDIFKQKSLNRLSVYPKSPSHSLIASEFIEKINQIQKEYSNDTSLPNQTFGQQVGIDTPVGYFFDASTTILMYDYYVMSRLGKKVGLTTRMKNAIKNQPRFSVLPICLDPANRSEMTCGEWRYSDSKVYHWVFAVVRYDQRTIEFYDSRNLEWVKEFWGKILNACLKEFYDDVFQDQESRDYISRVPWKIRNEIGSARHEKPLQTPLDSIVLSNYYSLVYYRLIANGSTYTQIMSSMLMTEGNLGILFSSGE